MDFVQTICSKYKYQFPKKFYYIFIIFFLRILRPSLYFFFFFEKMGTLLRGLFTDSILARKKNHKLDPDTTDKGADPNNPNNPSNPAKINDFLPRPSPIIFAMQTDSFFIFFYIFTDKC
jgi:hypothetical protein